MDIKSHLLNDEAMLHFVARGFCVVKTDVAPRVHAQILTDAERAMARGNPGNDILHVAPGLDEVFADPAIVGALSSILGDSYAMHCHRHCHLNRAGAEGRRFHQDGSPRRFQGWSRPWRRQHRPRTVMAIYYPHETPLAMGPTGVIPGTQYYGAQPDNASEYEFRFAVAEPGDVLLVHFDLWHRVSDNVSDRDRYMMKFLFERAEEPTAPSWAFAPDFEVLGHRLKPAHPSDVLLQHPLAWDFMWRWLRGESPAEWGDDAPVSVDDAIRELNSADPGVVLDATYALGRLGNRAVPALMDVLLGPDGDLRERVPAALSATGGHAVDALVDALAHSDDWVRATAADTLGDIGLPALGALPAIRRALVDSCDWVRHNAARALAIWGKAATGAREDLLTALQDAEPFVGFNALTALAHMDCIDAKVLPLLEAMQDHAHGRLRYQVHEVLRRVA